MRSSRLAKRGPTMPSTSSSPSSEALPEDSYVDRWSLVWHLLAELRTPRAAGALTRIVGSRIPR